MSSITAESLQNYKNFALLPWSTVYMWCVSETSCGKTLYHTFMKYYPHKNSDVNTEPNIDTQYARSTAVRVQQSISNAYLLTCCVQTVFRHTS